MSVGSIPNVFVRNPRFSPLRFPTRPFCVHTAITPAHETAFRVFDRHHEILSRQLPTKLLVFPKPPTNRNCCPAMDKRSCEALDGISSPCFRHITSSFWVGLWTYELYFPSPRPQETIVRDKNSSQLKTIDQVPTVFEFRTEATKLDL